MHMNAALCIIPCANRKQIQRQRCQTSVLTYKPHYTDNFEGRTHAQADLANKSDFKKPGVPAC